MPVAFLLAKTARIGGLFLLEKVITMRIPTTQELEKGMHINYQVLLEKKIEQDHKRAERKDRLQSDAIALMREFKESLSASGGAIDPDGRPLQYTGTFVKGLDNLWVARPVHALPVNSDHIMEFFIGVMVNADVPGGEWIYVPIKMWYQNGRLVLVSGEEEAGLEIHNDISVGRFFEASSMIKRSCLTALIDPRLN